MAYTIENNYTGNGTTRIFSFTFPYLEDTDVKVSLNQVDTTNFEFANATQINFTADAGGATSTQEASGAPKTSVAVRVYRDTNIDNLQSEFFSGSAVRAQDLNNDFNQTLYVSQETQDKVDGHWNDTSDTIDSTEAFEDVNTKIMTAAAIDDRIIANIAAPALADGKIWAGNGSGVGAQVTPSGDVTMANTGAFTIANTSVENGMIANDAINGNKIADNAIDSEHYTDGSIDTAHYAAGSVDTTAILDGTIVNSDISGTAGIAHSKLAALTDTRILVGNGSNVPVGVTVSGDATLTNTGALTIANDAVEQAMIADDAVGADQLASAAVVNDSVSASAAIAHSKLAAVPDTQILVGNGSTVPTAVAVSGDVTLANTGAVTIAADAVEIGMIGCEQTTITDSDSHLPTSGAVVDYVAAQLLPFGGFEAIADEDNFPTSQPASGVVISIKDATGVTVDGSGSSATARTAGNGSDNVTINGFPSSMNSAAVPASTGLLVTSTGSSHTYTFHRLLPTTDDVRTLSDDVNDFFARYRIAGSAPGSDNDPGDLYYDTGADKMYVRNAANNSWGEVTSTGEFKYLVLSAFNTGTGNAAVIDGSIAKYDLRETSTSGALASVTVAAQLMVSLNGVIQKANTGTSAPAEGFAMVDAHTIIFGANLQTGDSVFIIQIGSAVSIPTPGDDTVTSAKIVNGAIMNVDVNASAAIAGSKLADDSIAVGKLDIHNAESGTDKLLGYTSNGMEWVEGGSGTITWTLGINGGANAFTFTGDGFASATDDPTLYVTRGQTYKFVNGNSGGTHAFNIESYDGDGTYTSYTTGMTNAGATGGNTMTWVVPMNAPRNLRYVSGTTAGMNGNIVVDESEGDSGFRCTTGSTTKGLLITNGVGSDTRMAQFGLVDGGTAPAIYGSGSNALTIADTTLTTFTTGNVTLGSYGTNDTTEGRLHFEGGQASTTVGVTIHGPKTANIAGGASSYTIELPGAAPTANGQALTATTAGVATWATVEGTKADGCIYENSQTISNNYTITNNKNAMSAGPITIAATGNGDGSAVVVTVGDGETWTIV